MGGVFRSIVVKVVVLSFFTNLVLLPILLLAGDTQRPSRIFVAAAAAGVNETDGVAIAPPPGAEGAQEVSLGIPDKDDSENPTRIMVMTLGRSGSTMIGQLFRHSEGVFYLFEPCRAKGKGILGTYEMLWRDECLPLLHRLFRCDFTLEDADRLLVDRFASGYSSPVVGEAQMFVKSHRPSGDESATYALGRAHQVLSDTCMKSRVVVCKTIRLLDGIDGSTGYLASGINVLHLVRDPRAVVRSQLELWGMKRYRDVLPNYEELRSIEDENKRQTENRRAVGGLLCQSYRMQLDSPPYLDGKYLLVRYEDFVIRPHVVADEIYSSFGLGTVAPSLTTWIDDNTVMDNCDDVAGSGKHRRHRGSWNHRLVSADKGGAEDVGVPVDSNYFMEEYERTSGTAAGAAPDSDATPLPPRRENLRSTTSSAPLLDGSERSPLMKQSHQSNSSTMAKRRGRTPNDLLAPDFNTTATLGNTGELQASPTTGRGDLFLSLDGRRALEIGGGASGDDHGSSCGNRQHADDHPYDTHRHSREMVDLWRQQMPVEDIKAIWDACEESGVMADLGYSL